jgi:3,4-dihydroxy-2-butanone 4-phosphate synthase
MRSDYQCLGAYYGSKNDVITSNACCKYYGGGTVVIVDDDKDENCVDLLCVSRSINIRHVTGLKMN